MPEEGAPKQCAYQGKVNPSIVRTYEEDLAYIHRVSPWRFDIDIGFVPEVMNTYINCIHLFYSFRPRCN
jgi:hypothetical protein